jgi:hypothetical protein
VAGSPKQPVSFKYVTGALAWLKMALEQAGQEALRKRDFQEHTRSLEAYENRIRESRMQSCERWLQGQARSPVMAEFFERMERYRGHLAWLKNEIGDSKILVWLLAPLMWAGGLTAMQLDQYVIAIMFFFATFGVVSIKAIATTKDRERTVLIMILVFIFLAGHVVWVLYTHKQFTEKERLAVPVSNR